MTSISELQRICGEAAAAKGFHDDRPVPPLLGASENFKRVRAAQLRDWQGNKLMLIVSEIAEAQDELRKGYPANVTYHPTAVGDSWELERPVDENGVQAKPEGVPSELADAAIRILDFCFTEGIDLESIINEKLNYNATRERLHGKKF